MKKVNNIYIYIIGALLVTLSILSCDKLIYDNLEECPRGVYINVFAQTECADSPSYPSVKRLHVYAFDENGLFVDSKMFDEVTLSAEHESLMPVEKPGTYSFVVWGGINDHYTLQNLVKGTTTKIEVLLQLKQNGGKAADITGTQLYVGETPMVTVGLETDMFMHTKANVREITNRIKVTLKDVENPQDFVIDLLSGNSKYNVAGGIVNGEILQYPTDGPIFPNDSTLYSNFTTLKLESGRHNTLVVRNIKTGEEVFREDLVGVILLSPSSDNINLRCLNDFDVVLKMKQCDCPGGYMVAEIWINDWLVHSYDIVFGE